MIKNADVAENKFNVCNLGKALKCLQLIIFDMQMNLKFNPYFIYRKTEFTIS